VRISTGDVFKRLRLPGSFGGRPNVGHTSDIIEHIIVSQAQEIGKEVTEMRRRLADRESVNADGLNR
jgi:hypothetical protein